MLVERLMTSPTHHEYLRAPEFQSQTEHDVRCRRALEGIGKTRWPGTASVSTSISNTVVRKSEYAPDTIRARDQSCYMSRTTEWGNLEAAEVQAYRLDVCAPIAWPHYRFL